MNHRLARCQIDFVNSPSLHCNQDVIFHVSIRPNDKVIVRNHYQNGSWAMEERYGPCRVKKNETFEIVLLAEHQHYKIAVNGHHLGVFRHRLPLHLVRYVNVSGEVTLDHILLEQDQASSQNQMIVSQVVSTPAFQQTPIYPMMTPNYPIRPANPTVHVHVQPPVYPPPPYFGNQQHSVSQPQALSSKRFIFHHFSRTLELGGSSLKDIMVREPLSSDNVMAAQQMFLDFNFNRFRCKAIK